MDALIDFANVPEWNQGALAGFYRRYGIRHSMEGYFSGMESYAACRELPDIRFHIINFEQDKAKRAELIANMSQDAAKSVLDCSLFPGDVGFDRIFEELTVSQAEYRGFLDECISGNLNLNFVNSRVQLLNTEKPGYDIEFQPGENTWLPKVFLFGQRIRSVEDYIDLNSILFPLYSHEGERFSLTRKCKHCGNYFPAKTKRAEFCCDQCRKDSFRLNNKK